MTFLLVSLPSSLIFFILFERFASVLLTMGGGIRYSMLRLLFHFADGRCYLVCSLEAFFFAKGGLAGWLAGWLAGGWLLGFAF